MRGLSPIAFSLILGLAACGGDGNSGGGSTAGAGGGGGSVAGSGIGGGGTSAPQPLVYSGATTAATLSATSTGAIAANVMAAGGVVRTSGLIGGASVVQPKACNSGAIRISGAIAANGTGDVSVTFDNCRIGSDTLDGPAAMHIAAYDQAKAAITDATVTFTQTSFSGANGSRELSGTVRVQVTIPTHTRTLTANIVARDSTGRMAKTENLVIVSNYDNVLVPTFFMESITGRVFDSEAGYVDVTTQTADFTAPWGPLYYATSSQSFPDWGVIVLTGAPGTGTWAYRARITAVAVDLAKVEIDTNADGSLETRAWLRWADFNTPAGSDLADRDGDGMHNSWESVSGLNPFDPSDADGDRDGDGSSNRVEYFAGSNAATSGSVPPEVSTVFITGAGALGFDRVLPPFIGYIYVAVPSGWVKVNSVSLDLFRAAGPDSPAPTPPPDTGAFTYTSAGEQIDTATGTLVGTFAGVNPAQRNVNLVLPNASSGVVFYLTPSVTAGAPAGTWTLRSFRTTDRTLVGSLDITVPGHPRNMMRYNARGIAFDDDVGYVFLVQSRRFGL